MIFLLVAIAGAATTGSQVLIQAYVTSFYPSEMRSTGLGVASGIGRLGGMIGPILGGFLLTLTLPNFMNFMVFAITGVIAAIALSLIADKHSAYNQSKNEIVEEVVTENQETTVVASARKI